MSKFAINAWHSEMFSALVSGEHHRSKTRKKKVAD